MDITAILHAVAHGERKTPHETEWEERMRFEALYEEMEFIDDVHEGNLLPKDKVIEARQLEMDFFRRMKVYRKVPKALAKGKPVIPTRWVDTNKGSEAEPNYRSRLVGRELNLSDRRDLVAATPPLESRRYIVSRCASSQSRQRPHRILSIDVSRAYFYAESVRHVFRQFRQKICCQETRAWWEGSTFRSTALEMRRRIGQ